MKTILVSGASGIVGYGILKSLRRTQEKYNLIGTTIYDNSIAPAFCDIFEKAPMTDSPDYINWLCDVIKKYEVDMIIPGIEADMLTWNKERKILRQTGVFPLLNNPELIEICSDKWEFYKKLNSISPRLAINSKLGNSFEELEKDFGIPFLLKPRCGFGSKGIVKVEDEEIFLKNKYNVGTTLMAQPIVGSDEQEYTVSAFFDNNSNLICYMELKRKLSKDGYTENAQVVFLHGIRSIIDELAEIFKPVGPTNFQFRKHDNDLKLLEINPRISSATSIRAAFGYNESVMSVEYFLNGILPVQPTLKQGRAVRYTEEYIFYDGNYI